MSLCNEQKHVLKYDCKYHWGRTEGGNAHEMLSNLPLVVHSGPYVSSHVVEIMLVVNLLPI